MGNRKSETEFRLKDEKMKRGIEIRQHTVSTVYAMFEDVMNSQNWYMYLAMVTLLHAAVEDLYDTTRHAITPYCGKSVRGDLIRALSK